MTNNDVDQTGPSAGQTTAPTGGREKVAELRRAHKRGQRRKKLLVAGGGTVAVIVAAAVLVAFGLNHEAGPSQATTKVEDAVISGVSTVPADVFDAIGAGTALAAPIEVTGAEPLTEDGKPRVLYVGAEYCPFCAAERWSVIAALSRFGTFEGLGQTASAADDVLPNTPTLSFHGSTYTSDYLAFTGVEVMTNQRDDSGAYGKLDTLTEADQKTFDTLNAPPYVENGGSIPFITLGGKFIATGASYDPAVLKGKSHQDIASALSDPDSELAKAVDGVANVYTARLCELTGNKPADVCESAGVLDVVSKLAQ